jgi:hypothetical protein
MNRVMVNINAIPIPVTMTTQAKRLVIIGEKITEIIIVAMIIIRNTFQSIDVNIRIGSSL